MPYLSGWTRATTSLEHQHDVGGRPAAADKRVPVFGWVERLGQVSHLAVDELALARVTDARAARPGHGNVARLGQLEQADESRIPADGQGRGCEHHLRTRPGLPRRRVRRTLDSFEWLRSEDFGVDHVIGDADAQQ